jgi:hypothetical protein
MMHSSRLDRLPLQAHRMIDGTCHRSVCSNLGAHISGVGKSMIRTTSLTQGDSWQVPDRDFYGSCKPRHRGAHLRRGINCLHGRVKVRIPLHSSAPRPRFPANNHHSTMKFFLFTALVATTALQGVANPVSTVKIVLALRY